MAENAPSASAQATSSGNPNENCQNSKNNRGSGNKHRGNQRSYSQNRSRTNLNDSSQDEGYYSRGGPSQHNNPRGGKQGPRDDQRMSRQDQENELKNSRGHNNRRGGRLAYSSDRTRQGNSTDRNVATHSRDRSLQPVPSSSFSGAQGVFDLIKNDPSHVNKDTANKTHGGSNKNLSREGNGEHERRLNKNQRFNSSENIHKKRDSESFKRNPNQKFDGNRGHGHNQPGDRPRHMRNENGQPFQGPQRQPPNKRGPNNSGGNKPPYKVNKFNNEHYLRENQILNTIQTESHPELFSYEELARELKEQEPPAPAVKDVKNTINRAVEKRKKAGKLINSVKKSDDSQGNIPNEFKRRRKPGRLTLLNRIRKGLPVDSDDDEQDYVQVENKRKKGNEKKKKVLELLMNRRALLNEVPNDADSSDDNAISIDKNNTVKDQSMEAREMSIVQSPINIANFNNMETSDMVMKEFPVCEIQTNTNKQQSKVVSMSDSSDDSDETGEFDKRNQRKFDAFKLSNNLASHLAKHKLGQTNTTIPTQKDKAISNECKTDDATSGVKDLKEIIEARRKNENNSAREENELKEIIEASVWQDRCFELLR
uniref:Uncharacterized protein n=1 Tax=Cacopsylla melanoneura TaxID=428564 RepID=A0A8D8QJD5_9HEMI